MLTIRLIGHEHFYPLCDVARLFTGVIPRVEGDTIRVDVPSEAVIESRLSEGKALTSVVEGFPELVGELRAVRKQEDLPSSRECKRQLYVLLSRAYGKEFPWGALTGIRPTQVAREVDQEEDLMRIYGVREDKAKLAFATMRGEDDVLADSDPESLHVYVGIPFCPTRCAYCSFVAQEAPRKTKLLPSYAEAVLRELDLVLPKIRKPIETLYIGGGTPTVLDDELFTEFIRGVFSHPEFSSLREVTVEAGRPDTITEKKLAALREAGVTRICINPQTLSDATLLRVGRKHTAEDFLRKFELARSMGFSVINTDLIAGLPGESAEEFCDSLSQLIRLGPENITVHSLSKKRRADISREEVLREQEEELGKMEQMLSFSSRVLSEAGYAPYYLYKQKDTLGGHENVGYQKDGTSCIYNVAMMSDQRSVLSFGAGGMSKRVFLQKESHQVRIERCPCIKDAIQYIEDVEKMAEKKVLFFQTEGK